MSWNVVGIRNISIKWFISHYQSKTRMLDNNYAISNNPWTKNDFHLEGESWEKIYSQAIQFYPYSSGLTQFYSVAFAIFPLNCSTISDISFTYNCSYRSLKYRTGMWPRMFRISAYDSLISSSVPGCRFNRPPFLPQHVGSKMRFHFFFTGGAGITKTVVIAEGRSFTTFGI